MVVLGYPDTTLVTMDDMLHHCKAVARGAKHSLIVCDLPFESYQTSAIAVENARRLMDAGADAVKLEGGVIHEPKIAAITAAGIPVMGHIGMLPQSIKAEGGYKIKGRSPQEEESLLADAKAIERAGAFAVVMELIAPDVSKKITGSISIPTIGIGSGAGCDGQVLVIHDVIGLFPWFKPKFAKRRAQVSEEIRIAVAAYIQDVKAGG
jgi:3-methyl-2-oxobutanoate hydroxymethyltransferase